MKADTLKNFILDPSVQIHDHPFIISSKVSLTFRNFSALVDSALVELKGISRAGERVAILSGNCPEYLVLLFAMWRLKIVPVFIHTRWPAHYILKNLHRIHCRQIICASNFFSLRLKGIKKERLENVVNLSHQNLPPVASEPIHFRLHQDGSVIFTSGSVGNPKAVLHTLGNHYYNAFGSNQNIHLRPGDRWLLSLPLYHVGGLGIVFRALLAGAAVVIPDREASLEKTIQIQPVTHLSLVATQLYRLLQEKRVIPHLKKMKAILLGGGPIPLSLLRKCAEEKLPIYLSYGSTEMASQITTTFPGDGLNRWKTAGKPLPFRELKLAADGEILVRGKTLCRGYIDSGRVKKVTDKAGWFHSGDLGCFDKEDYLIISGRKDNLFISGGENIQPEEIEEQIRNIPGVEEVVVVPVNDPEFGQRPVAILKIQETRRKAQGSRRKAQGSRRKVQGARGKRNQDLNTRYQIPNRKYKIEGVREYLRKVLPGYKVPDYFLPWPEEVSTGLKISREEFRRWAQMEIDKRQG